MAFRPERLEDGVTITKFVPEGQERRWLCARSYKDEKFRTCMSMKVTGLCPEQWEEVPEASSATPSPLAW